MNLHQKKRTPWNQLHAAKNKLSPKIHREASVSLVQDLHSQREKWHHRLPAIFRRLDPRRLRTHSRAHDRLTKEKQASLLSVLPRNWKSWTSCRPTTLPALIWLLLTSRGKSYTPSYPKNLFRSLTR